MVCFAVSESVVSQIMHLDWVQMVKYFRLFINMDLTFLSDAKWLVSILKMPRIMTAN